MMGEDKLAATHNLESQSHMAQQPPYWKVPHKLDDSYCLATNAVTNRAAAWSPVEGRLEDGNKG